MVHISTMTKSGLLECWTQPWGWNSPMNYWKSRSQATSRTKQHKPAGRFSWCSGWSFGTWFFWLSIYWGSYTTNQCSICLQKVQDTDVTGTLAVRNVRSEVPLLFRTCQESTRRPIAPLLMPKKRMRCSKCNVPDTLTWSTPPKKKN